MVYSLFAEPLKTQPESIDYTGKEGTNKVQTTVQKTNFNTRKSKLETYLELLRFFALDGPLSVNDAHRLNPNGKGRKEFRFDVAFLEKQSLLSISEPDQMQKRYAVTERGTRVLSYFEMLPFGIHIEDIEGKEKGNGTASPIAKKRRMG